MAINAKTGGHLEIGPIEFEPDNLLINQPHQKSNIRTRKMLCD